MTERFQPGGVTHALVSGLLELALASALLAGSLAVSESSQGAAASLAVASLLWAVLAVVSLAVAWLRARVLAAELDDEAVVLHGLGGRPPLPLRRPVGRRGVRPPHPAGGPRRHRPGGPGRPRPRPGQPLPGPGPGPRQGRRRG